MAICSMGYLMGRGEVRRLLALSLEDIPRARGFSRVCEPLRRKGCGCETDGEEKGLEKSNGWRREGAGEEKGRDEKLK
jgi:hypothetical protein